MATWRADAAIATDAVDAGGSALAGLGRALVHIDAAVWAGESLGAHAAKPARTRLTGAAVVARLPAALVDGLGAEETRPARGTAAVGLQGLIRGAGHAGAAILALASIAAGGSLRATFT